MAGVVPVFILNNQLPAFDQKPFSTSEICSAVEKTSGFETVEGAQRIGGLWRIYPCSTESRQKILFQGFNIRGVRVEVKDKNPFLVSSPDGVEKEIPATKLIISNVPMSFSDEEIMRTIKKLNVSVRSKLIAERDRDSNGKLTRWKTGRRFLYIGIPTEPLPKLVEMGPFKATLFHKEQKLAQKQYESECGRCLEKGHRTVVCEKPIKCRQCFKDGHKAGDSQCEMTPVTQAEDKSPVRHRHSKSPIRHSKSKSPVCHRTADSVSTTASEGSRGRPLRREKNSKRDSKGQTTLNFRRDSSRSGSSKRPRSKSTTSPQHPKDKHQRRRSKEEDKSAPSDYDELTDVLPS